MLDIFVNFWSDVRLEIREQHASNEGLNFLELRGKVSERCDALQVNSQDVTWRRYQVKRTCVKKKLVIENLRQQNEDSIERYLWKQGLVTLQKWQGSIGTSSKPGISNTRTGLLWHARCDYVVGFTGLLGNKAPSMLFCDSQRHFSPLQPANSFFCLNVARVQI